MVLRMPRPTTRENSSRHQLRRRVPSDILEMARGKLILVELPAMNAEPAVTLSATAGAFIKFSLRTGDPTVAKYRHAAANSQLDRQFNAWRSGPASLTHRNIVALSGEVYRLYVERFEENPGSADNWAAFKAFNRAASEGRLLNAPAINPGEGTAPAAAAAIFGSDLTAGVNALPASSAATVTLERRFGRLTDWVLQKHGLSVDQEARSLLLVQVERASTDAAWALKRNAGGDYTPDANASRFPAVRLTSTALTLDALFEKWEAETQPAASTLTTWRGNMRSLKEHLGDAADDISKITPEHIVAWKDAAVARGRAAKTINSSYLGSINTLLNHAVRNKLLASNPADGVRVAARSRAGTSMQPYSDAEVTRLLELAKGEADPSRRWLPWLAASSGARIGELVQLWGKRVVEIDGIPAMVLIPAEDGGSLKNEGSERTVPIHPAIIQAGFLDFIKSKGDGPLFYRRSSGRATKRHASKGVSNRLAEWIREAGFTDPRKAPNHAFRHYFKSVAAKVGISDSLADAIQGHAAKSEAGRYRHFELQTMAEAVALIPIPPMLAPQRNGPTEN